MQGSHSAAALALAGVISMSIAVALAPQGKVGSTNVTGPMYASVAPILKKCTPCHSGPHPKHSLDLTTYANVMKGDKEGKVVIPGKPKDSRLSEAVRHAKGATAMPPGGTLPPADVAKIDNWIKFGARP